MEVIYFLATENFIKLATMIQTTVSKHSDKSEELAYFSKCFLSQTSNELFVAHSCHDERSVSSKS